MTKSGSVFVAPLTSRCVETAPPVDDEVLTADRPGSDFMVDIIKSPGFVTQPR